MCRKDTEKIIPASFVILKCFDSFWQNKAIYSNVNNMETNNRISISFVSPSRRASFMKPRILVQLGLFIH